MNFLDLDTNLQKIVSKLNQLMDSFWKYAIAALALVIVVWGIYIGMKIIVANRNDEKVNAKGMLKNLLIGVVVIFVIAVGAPLLIQGLESWVTSPALDPTPTPPTEGLALILNVLRK